MSDFFKELKIGAIRGLGALLILLPGFSLTFVAAQQIATFTSGQVVSASDINTNFANIKTSIANINTGIATLTSGTALKPPIGSIIAWHKSAPGVPSLPDGWMECDGSTVIDSSSPLNGIPLPDLNVSTRFLRGGSVSGSPQAQSLQSHAHDLLATTDFSGTGSPGVGHCAIQTTDRVDGCVGSAPSATVSGLIFADGGVETRPINMSVVWIIRVK